MDGRAGAAAGGLDTSELEALLASIGEGRPTAEDGLIIRHLSADGVRDATRRLAAVLSKERGDVDAVAAAAAAGLSIAQFYKIARDWRAVPELASLGVRGGPIRRRASSLGSARDDAASWVEGLLESDPGVSVAEAMRLAERDLRRPPSKTTLSRLIRERRPVAAGPFGGRLVLDSLGLDLRAPMGGRLRLVVFVDAGTGLVLKHFEASEQLGARSYVLASASQSDWFVGKRVPPLACHDGPVGIDVRIAPDDLPGLATFRSLERVPSPTGPRAGLLGRAAAAALGDRIGGVWAGVGFRSDGVGFRTGRRKHLPEEDVAISEAIGSDVDRHNREILARLPRAKSTAPMEAALQRLRTAFVDIEALEEGMPPFPDEPI